MTNTSNIITHTKKWLSGFIIHHNICPFAKHEFDKGSIYYDVVDSDSLEEQLQALILACSKLDNETEIETTLLIFPRGLDDFDEYLDFLALSNALMEKQGYEGVYQLASFHPDYCFEGVPEDDASNYTNRAPYPTLHLIREDSLEKVLANYPNPEKIPERNIEFTQKLGVKALQKFLTSCYKH
jgi:hypothetical protein